ncbi:coproporphyrinogen III oxidase, aerobic [Pelagophyceae sp. CCMP2097]|nr:coproporphyrinogen III oxidase, aerobic [Pelagophyceae sp. CCMP2097]
MHVAWLLAFVPGASALAPASGSAALDAFSGFLAEQQAALVSAYEAIDGSGATFGSDVWSRADGSSGVTRVLQRGAVIDKGCVSTSFVRGALSPARAAAMTARGRAGVDAGAPFAAAALSIVLHAKSPQVPTFRADIRLFCVFDAEGRVADSWYGGGADLTPTYVYDDDCVHFHTTLRTVCDKHDATLYPALKKQCDEYFYLPFRQEHRGVGGIFYDDCTASEVAFDPDAFSRDVLGSWIEAWRPIVDRRRDAPFTAAQKEWQLMRRGRYLEFNLMADRGVRFGLSPDAIERVMVSAPPIVAWEYNAKVEQGSPEANLVHLLKNPRNWLAA